MAQLIKFNEDYSPYLAGNTYLVSDENAINFIFSGVGVAASETKLVDDLGSPFNVGVCNGINQAVLSDTVDLPNSGYIQPRLLAGNIKVTDVNGNVNILAFDLKEISAFRVKRIWNTDTTPNMGIVVYY